MPKERFHLLVADQMLPSLPALIEESGAAEGQRLAYLLGAIAPDTLFYDIPFFGASPVSAALHRLEGLAGVEFLQALLTDCRRELTPDTNMWLLGVAVHLLTDGFWHPIVEKMASFHCRRWSPGRSRLSQRQAHHWVESDLEGFWLHRAGSRDGYRQVLQDFARPGKTRTACIHCFQMILKRLGAVEVPTVGRIGRCFSWQAFLLDQFSLPIWAKWREPLLRFRGTRSWGTLIVPPQAQLGTSSILRTEVNGSCRDSLEDAFSDQLMTRSLSFLTNHLLSLAARL